VDLNPNDTNPSRLLKGPCSDRAIWHTASSGALIITTKKGEQDKGLFFLQFVFFIDKVSKLPERQNLYSQGDGGHYKALNRLSWGALIDTLYRTEYPMNMTRMASSLVVSPLRKSKAVVYDPYKFFNTGLT